MTRIAATMTVAFSGLLLLFLCFSFAQDRQETRRDSIAPKQEPAPPATIGHPAFMSPHASPIALSGGRVYVTNTPADTVDVIDAKTHQIGVRINVGVNPVGIAVRPDGKEVWVANHISDSVSVIDIDPASPTCFQVIATIQDFDPDTKATRFDEPVGIAFASNEKAYVSVSSENKIAVVDVATRQIQKRLEIAAQDPRAIVVRDGRLYVLPFESNNQTQLSGGSKDKIDGDLVTFDAWDHSIANNNVLSLGHVVDIIKHPKVPDRDLFVFDTQTDMLVKTVNTLGTLLYGMAVDSKGRAFIAQTDARNEVNGRAGTKKHGLAELQNRAFLNRITSVRVDGDSAEPTFFDLEPLPPNHPAAGMALATPFAIQVSDDDSTLVASAAHSDKLFTVDTTTGAILGRVDVGAVPEGIALQSSASGKPEQAWVLNAAANTVSLVDVTDPATPKVVATVSLEDPTHPAVKRGRIAFSTASASTTGTFSCASCHPDGHTDQLLWVLKTPIVTGGNQIMPRSTMPVRGLRDTAPFHWDGIPGDPYGGINSAHIREIVPPNSSVDHPESSTRNLVDGGLASTMAMEGDPSVNDEGKPGKLTAAQRDDMAKFLLSVPYPPSQRRSYDNVLSSEASKGFKLFHIDGDLDPGKPQANVCGDCHRMPFLVSTNTPGTGMDAPTWRGAYDRWLILPQGRLNIVEFDFYRRVAEQGTPERNVWQFSWGGRRRFDPVWEMVLEGCTGFSGSFARQVTLNQKSVDEALSKDLLDALERSANEGGIVLQAEGVLLEDGKSKSIALQFDPEYLGGTYVRRDGDRESFSRGELSQLAKEGRFIGTFTGRLGNKVDYDNPQPALWTQGPIEKQRGKQDFPILYVGNTTMTVSGRHIQNNALVVVDGHRVPGTVQCNGETVRIELASLPTTGMHFLQVQNSDGLFSNDFIFHVTENAEAAAELNLLVDEARGNVRDQIAEAIARGNLEATQKLVAGGTQINARRSQGGSTPLSTAAVYNRVDIARMLLKNGAKVEATNEDGNTPLHVAAFFCHAEMIQLLLDNGASPLIKNKRGETAIDVVSGEWSQGLGEFYTGIGTAIGLELNLDFIQRERPNVAKSLRDSLGGK